MLDSLRSKLAFRSPALVPRRARDEPRAYPSPESEAPPRIGRDSRNRSGRAPPRPAWRALALAASLLCATPVASVARPVLTSSPASHTVSEPGGEGGIGATLLAMAALPHSGIEDRRRTRGPGPELLLPAARSAAGYRRTVLGRVSGHWIIAGAVLCTVEAILIGVLLAEHRRRRTAQAASHERQRFEELLAEVTATIDRVPVARLDGAIEEALARLVEFLDVDHAGLAELEPNAGALRITHWWASRNVSSPMLRLRADEVPHLAANLSRGIVVCLASLDDLPPEAATDRSTLARLDVKAMAALPTAVNGAVTAALILTTLTRERCWPDELLPRLRLLADVLATAVARRRADAEIRDGEALNTAMLESLAARVAILDRSGVVVRANLAWRTAGAPAGGGADGGALVDANAGDGVNVLDGFRRAMAQGSSVASDALFGIESVLAGARQEFTMEYAGAPSASERYFEMIVEALRRPGGGAVITVRETTARKRAEADARRRAEEVAHLSRVAAASGLATSIAHELKQPLTAIRANAQAASRLLAANPPDVPTVAEILRDVTDAVVRAAGVIDGMRDLLKRGGPRLARVDVNEAVHAVVRLVATSAAGRRTQVSLELETGLPAVLGDPVQLQQVLLNLVLNALEAMDAQTVGVRRVTISTAAAPPSVLVSVRDTGPGLPEGDVFESFYTTKAAGLGMGLSVARLIVEAHGGRVLAGNSVEGGAVFEVLLPATEELPS